MAKAKTITARWESDKDPIGTDGKPTYKKPLEIVDATDRTLEDILDEIDRGENTDEIEEI